MGDIQLKIISYLEQSVSAVIIFGLLILLLNLIVRRSRLIGPAQPLHKMQWFLEIFKRGARNILQCPWVVWILAIGIVVGTAEQKAQRYLYLKRNPQIKEQMEQMLQSHQTPPFEFLRLFFRSLPRHLLEAANLNSWVYSAFRSVAFQVLFLVLIIIILLRQGRAQESVLDRERTSRGNLLAFTTGIAAIFIIISYVRLVVLSKTPNMSLLIYTGMIIFYSFTPAFAYAIFIHALDSAEQGRRESLFATIEESARYFLPLFLFFFLIIGILPAVANLPLYLSMFSGGAGGIPYGRIARATDAGQDILLIMISLVPLLVVMRKTLIAPALDQCADLWAREWKNIAAFIILGSLLMVIPVSLDFQPFRLFISPAAGTAYHLVVWSLKVALSILLLSSFVALLRELEE